MVFEVQKIDDCWLGVIFVDQGLDIGEFRVALVE